MRKSEVKKLVVARKLLEDRIGMFTLLKGMVANKKELSKIIKDTKNDLKKIESMLKEVEVTEKIEKEAEKEVEKLWKQTNA